ncbi:hypothetical protein WEI85_26630 [Actinomycetes bacterium KLBMP 9797]
MADDYWGAQVTWSSASVPGGNFYEMPDDRDIDFTPHPDEADTSIESIYPQIMNQHPEYISLLADRWQNAHDLLVSVRDQLRRQSDRLYHEHWRSARARDAFMAKGPGEALVYLDAWIEAVRQNVTGLRSVVEDVHDARGEMEELWQRYQDEVEAAQNLGWREEGRALLGGFDINITGGGGARLPGFSMGFDTSDEREGEAMANVAEVAEDRSHDARRIAYRLGNAYSDALTWLVGGHGPLFKPMDAVYNPPHPPMPAVPDVSGLSGAPPAIGTPPAFTIPAPPPVPTAPPVPQAPAPPTVHVPTLTPPAPPAVPVPPAPGTGPRPVQAPGVPPLPAVPPARPGVRPGPAIRAPGIAAAGAGGATAGAAAPAAPPAGRTIGRPTLPPAAQAPPPGRTIDRKRPAPGEEKRPSLAAPATGEEPFTRPPNAAPPVLNNPRAGRDKPDRRERQRPAEPAPTHHDPTAVPPVLRPPAASRPAPPVSGRRAPRPTAPPLPGSPEWGIAGARAGAADPVLKAPTPPAPPRQAEVPARLRGRAPSRDAAPEVPARRPVADSAASPGPIPDEEQKIITDEAAFGVETPGGGVVGRRPADRGYRAEPPTAL